MSDEKKLTGRDRQIAAAVAVGRTIAETAAELKIGTTTVSRAIAKAGFKELVFAMRREAVDRLFNKFVGGAEEAVEVLCRLMREGTPKDAVKCRAAQAVIGFLVTIKETSDLHAAIDETKAMIKALDEPKPLPPASEPNPVAVEKPATQPERGADFDLMASAAVGPSAGRPR